jgi:cell division protease FtsH
VKKILDRAYTEAKEMLTVHRDQLELVTAELLKRETLDAATFYHLIGKPVPRAAPLTPPPVPVGRKEVEVVAVQAVPPAKKDASGS